MQKIRFTNSGYHLSVVLILFAFIYLRGRTAFYFFDVINLANALVAAVILILVLKKSSFCKPALRIWSALIFMLAPLVSLAWLGHLYFNEIFMNEVTVPMVISGFSRAIILLFGGIWIFVGAGYFIQPEEERASSIEDHLIEK